MSEMPIEDALEILSNKYRRDILRLIAIKERYAFELSKMLDISQRAVSNHLRALEEAGLVESEKRKSRKGPKREYFHLSKAVVLSLTVAPNLFLATIRPLNDPISTPFDQLDPRMQLGTGSEEGSVRDTLGQGLELLPQIREGLDLLEARQSKLLRAYQGLRNHLTGYLEEHDFSTKEIRLILQLIEKDGEMTKEELEIAMGDSMEGLTDLISGLKEKNIVTSDFYETEDGMDFTVRLTLNNNI